MPILNYTTTVAVAKTVGEIHQLLVKAKARHIATAYDDAGTPVGVTFDVGTAYGLRTFTLPVQVKAVENVLRRQRVEARFRTPSHAERVAWRIVKDWLEAQLAMLEAEQVSLDQVMLPYMSTGDRTVYEVYRDQQIEALGPGDDT